MIYKLWLNSPHSFFYWFRFVIRNEFPRIRNKSFFFPDQSSAYWKIETNYNSFQMSFCFMFFFHSLLHNQIVCVCKCLFFFLHFSSPPLLYISSCWSPKKNATIFDLCVCPKKTKRLIHEQKYLNDHRSNDEIK